MENEFLERRDAEAAEACGGNVNALRPCVSASTKLLPWRLGLLAPWRETRANGRTIIFACSFNHASTS